MFDELGMNKLVLNSNTVNTYRRALVRQNLPHCVLSP
jgi:hypothetical protein